MSITTAISSAWAAEQKSVFLRGKIIQPVFPFSDSAVDVVVVNVVVVRTVVIVVNVDDTFKPLNYNIYGLQNALSRG